MQLNDRYKNPGTILLHDSIVSIQISHYKFGIDYCIKKQPLWIWYPNSESIQIYLLMNNSLVSSTSISHHLHHQEQESWSMTSLKINKHMLPMNQMDGTLAEHRYITDASNIICQAPNPKELQTKLTSPLTILAFPKPHQQMQKQL